MKNFLQIFRLLLAICFAPSARCGIALKADPFPAIVQPGQPITHSVTVQNVGLEAATGIILSNQYSLAASIQSATADHGAASFDARRCATLISSLQPGESATVHFDLKIIAGVAVVAADVSSDQEPDPGPDARFVAISHAPVAANTNQFQLALPDRWARRDITTGQTYFPIAREYLARNAANSWIVAFDERALRSRIVMELPRPADAFDMSPEGRWAFYYNSETQRAYQIDLQQGVEGVSYSIAGFSVGLIVPPNDPTSVFAHSNQNWTYRGSITFDIPRDEFSGLPVFGATSRQIFWPNLNPPECGAAERQITDDGMALRPEIKPFNCAAAAFGLPFVFSNGKLFAPSGEIYDTAKVAKTNALHVADSFVVIPAPERGVIYQLSVKNTVISNAWYGFDTIRVFDFTNYTLLKAVNLAERPDSGWHSLRLIGEKQVSLADDDQHWLVFDPMKYEKPLPQITFDWHQTNGALINTLTISNTSVFPIQHITGYYFVGGCSVTNLVVSPGSYTSLANDRYFDVGTLGGYSSATVQAIAIPGTSVAEATAQITSWTDAPFETPVTTDYLTAAVIPITATSTNTYYAMGAWLAAYDPNTELIATTYGDLGNKLWIFDRFSGRRVVSFVLPHPIKQLFIDNATSKVWMPYTDTPGLQAADLRTLQLAELIAPDKTIVDVEPAPLEPASLVIAESNATAVYRNGVRLPRTLSSGILTADPAGAVFIARTNGVTKALVQADGIVASADSAEPAPPGDLTALGDRLFFSSGVVCDFPSMTPVRALVDGLGFAVDGSGPPAIDRQRGIVYQPSSRIGSLIGFHATTLERLTATPATLGAVVFNAASNSVATVSGREMFMRDIPSAYTDLQLQMTPIGRFYLDGLCTNRFQLQNIGSAIISNLVFTNLFVDQFDIVGVSSTIGTVTISSNLLRWEIPRLPVLTTADIRIAGYPRGPTNFSCKAGFTFDGQAADATNNFADVSVPLQRVEIIASDLRVVETSKTNAPARGMFRVVGSTQPLPIAEVTILPLSGTADTNDVLLLTQTAGASASSRTFNLTIVGDTNAEPTEQFYFLLTNSTIFPIAKPVGHIQIIDDDAHPIFITPYSGVVNRTNDAARIQIGLSNPSANSITVKYRTLPQTAVPGLDYSPIAGELTFLPNTLVQTIEVPIISNKRAECSFLIYLLDPSSGVLLQRYAKWTIR